MKVTERGQITLPKWLREKHGIDSSTEVEFVERDGEILIVKKRAVSSLTRFRGIAKVAGLPSETDEFLSLVRDGDENEISSR